MTPFELRPAVVVAGRSKRSREVGQAGAVFVDVARERIGEPASEAAGEPSIQAQLHRVVPRLPNVLVEPDISKQRVRPGQLVVHISARRSLIMIETRDKLGTAVSDI